MSSVINGLGGLCSSLWSRVCNETHNNDNDAVDGNNAGGASPSLICTQPTAVGLGSHVPGKRAFPGRRGGGNRQGTKVRSRSAALPRDRRFRRMPLHGRGHVTQPANMRVTAKQRGCDRGKRDK